MCFLWQAGKLALVSLNSAPGGLWLEITALLWVVEVCVCIHLFSCQVAAEQYEKKAYTNPELIG